MDEKDLKQNTEQLPEEPVREDIESALDITDFIDEQKKLRGREHRLRDFEFFGLRALIFVIIIWAFGFFVVGFAAMNGDDMYPRIDGGDLMLFYRLDREPAAQDVIVFEKNGNRYVGRVVAVPGDTVEVTESDSLKINGSTMQETNIFYRTPQYDSEVEYPLTLEYDQYFVLSDNRLKGTDSRWFGPVDKSEIAGTVISIMRRNHI